MSKIKVRMPDQETLNKNNPYIKNKELSPSLLNEDKEVTKIRYIDINSIDPYQHQVRQIFDEEELEGLSNSLKARGINDIPIYLIAKRNNDGNKIPNKFEVIDGERRLRAAKIAGIKELKAIIIQDPKDAKRIALVANLARSNYEPFETANSIQRYLDEAFASTIEEAARHLGIKRRQATYYLQLLKLNQEVIDFLNNKNIPISALRDWLTNKDVSLITLEEAKNFLLQYQKDPKLIKQQRPQIKSLDRKTDKPLIQINDKFIRMRSFRVSFKGKKKTDKQELDTYINEIEKVLTYLKLQRNTN